MNETTEKSVFPPELVKLGKIFITLFWFSVLIAWVRASLALTEISGTMRFVIPVVLTVIGITLHIGFLKKHIAQQRRQYDWKFVKFMRICIVISIAANLFSILNRQEFWYLDHLPSSAFVLYVLYNRSFLDFFVKSKTQD